MLHGQSNNPRIAVGGILHESNTFSEKKTDLREAPVAVGTPQGDEVGPARPGGSGAARDGRFLINTVVDEATSSSITLLQNW